MERGMWRHLRVRCPICDKEVAARTPRGGDGTVVRPYRHLDESKKPCEGRFHDVDLGKTFDA